MLVMGAALVLLIGACATIPDRATTDSITLDKPVHFLAQGGNDVVAASGTYRIEALVHGPAPSRRPKAVANSSLWRSGLPIA